MRNIRSQADARRPVYAFCIWGTRIGISVYQRYTLQEYRDSKGTERSRLRPDLVRALLMHFFREARSRSYDTAAISAKAKDFAIFARPAAQQLLRQRLR